MSCQAGLTGGEGHVVVELVEVVERTTTAPSKCKSLPLKFKRPSPNMVRCACRVLRQERAHTDTHSKQQPNPQTNGALCNSQPSKETKCPDPTYET